MASGSRCADVDALEHGDPGVRAQRPRELAAPHVDRDDVLRPALEQAVGEPASGGAGVEGAGTGDVDVQPVECTGELLAATRHEPGRRAHDADRLVICHLPCRRVSRRTRDEHSSSRDRLDRALPAAHQAAADELGVQPPAHRAYGDCLVAEADFFAALVAFLVADFLVDEPPAAFFAGFADFLATFAAFLAFFAGFLALFFAFLAAFTGPGRRPGRREATPSSFS